MRSLFELGPVTQRHVQTPVRGAVSLRARSVGIDDGSVIRDDRQLLDHPDTDRWIDAPMPRPNRLVLMV
jgi:hypothetical protein